MRKFLRYYTTNLKEIEELEAINEEYIERAARCSSTKELIMHIEWMLEMSEKVAKKYGG